MLTLCTLGKTLVSDGPYYQYADFLRTVSGFEDSQITNCCLGPQLIARLYSKVSSHVSGESINSQDTREQLDDLNARIEGISEKM